MKFKSSPFFFRFGIFIVLIALARYVSGLFSKIYDGGTLPESVVLAQSAGAANIWEKLRYFKSHEFDSKDTDGSGKGTGVKMNAEFMLKLDEARHIANVPFHINSGFRTAKHNAYIDTIGYDSVENSPHMIGRAADIQCNSIEDMKKKVTALITVGFKRIIMYRGNSYFIHVDNAEKPNVFTFRVKVNGKWVKSNPFFEQPIKYK